MKRVPSNLMLVVAAADSDRILALED